MKLTAMTIMVYFVGLVTFEGDPSEKRRVVNVPLASPSVTFGGKTLTEHRTDVIITGWTSGATECASKLGGTWSGSECTVEGLSAKNIKLPASTDEFVTTEFFRMLPKLRDLCPGLGGLRTDAAYAARLTIEHGKLNACAAGQAWISSLELTTSSGQFDIGNGSPARLNDNVVIYIFNHPPAPDGTAEQHFWWYYAVRQTAGACRGVAGVPATVTTADCPTSVLAWLTHHMSIPVASGVGCTNTAYP